MSSLFTFETRHFRTPDVSASVSESPNIEILQGLYWTWQIPFLSLPVGVSYNRNRWVANSHEVGCDKTIWPCKIKGLMYGNGLTCSATGESKNISMYAGQICIVQCSSLSFVIEGFLVFVSVRKRERILAEALLWSAWFMKTAENVKLRN